MSVLSRKRGSLSEGLIRELSSRIEQGVYGPGDRMPSEHQMCQEFGVSRTVVREAVASLRLSGMLVSRPGVGVFVTRESPDALDVRLSSPVDNRAALHIMELRLGLEVQAAGLAAERRSSQGLAEIVAAYDAITAAAADSQAATVADYSFHLAIARASGNPHFPHLLESCVKEVLTDLQAKRGARSGRELRLYEKRTAREHSAIMMAIVRGDPISARSAMFRHLDESIKRYRRQLGQYRACA